MPAASGPDIGVEHERAQADPSGDAGDRRQSEHRGVLSTDVVTLYNDVKPDLLGAHGDTDGIVHQCVRERQAESERPRHTSQPFTN